MNGRQQYDITNVDFFVDSLGDPHTLYNKTFFGIHFMRYITGLQKESPEGSFSNGIPWTDYFISSIANEFLIKQFEREKHLRADDISDEIINNDSRLHEAVEDYYSLKNDVNIKYRGRNFARTYTEGGLTAHDYSWIPSKSLNRFFARLILPTLEEKRKAALDFDKKNKISAEVKAKTLSITWCGANDLITVNERASQVEVDKAIAEQIKHIEELLKNGYRHFCVFNLPNLNLTPRYQNGSAAERANAEKWSNYFNEQLKLKCDELKRKHQTISDFTLDIFDVAANFKDMYNNPEKYGLDKNKLDKPYIESPDFKITKEHTSPAKGYMFWDRQHPTTLVHEKLAAEYEKEFREFYHFVPPKREPRQKHLRRTDSLPNIHPGSKPQHPAPAIPYAMRNRQKHVFQLFSNAIKMKVDLKKQQIHPATVRLKKS